MKTPTLTKRLAEENLTHLAQRTGINIRTLRRIKAGVTKTVHPLTAAAIEQALRK